MTNFKNENTFVQFELWKDCKIGCKFCCNKGQPKIDKLQSLQFITAKLKELQIIKHDEIGFIGGEFFNGELDPLIKPVFYNLFYDVSKLNFSKIYITAALIYDINVDLIPFLDYLRKIQLLDKIVLCTSFDVKYRFKTQEHKELWKRNMLFLKDNYPELRLHTEIILTEWFLNAVLNDEFDLKAFKDVFNTSVDYIEPSSGLYYVDKYACEKDLPGFFPKKETFLKFLKKSIRKDLINRDSFLSMELRSNTLFFIENGKVRIAEDRRSGDGRCELSDKTKKYDIGFIDSNNKMYDVAQTFFKLYGN